MPIVDTQTLTSGLSYQESQPIEGVPWVVGLTGLRPGASVGDGGEGGQNKNNYSPPKLNKTGVPSPTRRSFCLNLEVKLGKRSQLPANPP